MQEIIVFLIVVAAFVYLARQWWPSKNKGGGCSSCALNSRSASEQNTKRAESTLASQKNLIQIGVQGLSQNHAEEHTQSTPHASQKS